MKRASTSLATPDATKKKRVSFNSVVEFRELTTTTPESTPTTPATTTRATTSDGEPVAANKSPVDDAENATGLFAWQRPTGRSFVIKFTRQFGTGG